MGDLSVSSGGRGQSVPNTLSLLPGMTASPTPHNKGSWLTMIADTKEPLIGLWAYLGSFINTAGANNQRLTDIGIAPVGAAINAESVLVANIAWGHQNGYPNIFLPIKVPAGYRISGRTQSLAASGTNRLGITTIPAGGALSMFEGCDKSATVGVITANTTGTPMSLPGAINTKGAWTVLTASTPFAARWITFVISGVDSAAVIANTNILADLGYGGAGSEQSLISDVPVATTASEQIFSSAYTVPCNIPAGSRIVARYQAGSSVAAASNPCASAILFG
jgi:hypothetical protein